MHEKHRFFGEVAIEMGLVRVDQVLEVLLEQARDQRIGRATRKIGDALVEMGELTEDDVSVVLGELFPCLRE